MISHNKPYQIYNILTKKSRCPQGIAGIRTLLNFGTQECGGGRSGFVITWDGKMYPCNRLTEVEMLPLREGLASSWQKINTACNNWPRVAECDGCPYYAVCDNCPANMTQYAVLGKRPTKICERARVLVRHGILTLPLFV